mgnify:CR=1 FL=1
MRPKTEHTRKIPSLAPVCHSATSAQTRFQPKIKVKTKRTQTRRSATPERVIAGHRTWNALPLRRATTLWICTLACLLACSSQTALAQSFPVQIQRGNGLGNVFAKLNSGQTATFAFLGGSITQGWGYRDLTIQWLRDRYPGRINEINAGWGGTGSLIGAIRIARDVLASNPDVIFIEFAVNDLPEDPLLFVQRNYDGMLRQIRAHNLNTDVCFLETIAPYNVGPYLGGQYPTAVKAHNDVGDHYGAPTVNIGWHLYLQVLGGTPWQNLAPDQVHPNAAGSQVYADALIAYLNAERNRSPVAAPHTLPNPLTDFPVTSSEIIEMASLNNLSGAWVKKFNQSGAASFIESSTPGATVTLNFTGPAAAAKVILNPSNGNISYSVDGEPFRSGNLPTPGFEFIWAFPVAKMFTTNAAHTLTLRVDSGTAKIINVESAKSTDIEPPGDEINLALTATQTQADSFFGAGFEPENARDGSVGTKWNSTDAATQHHLALDLGVTADIKRVVVKHAGAGGEFTEFNTAAFAIQSGPSISGPWTNLQTVDNAGQLASSTIAFSPVNRLRYIRLLITDAGIDDYARIYEFEVWGLIPKVQADFDSDGDVDQSDFGKFQACLTGPGVPQLDPACEPMRLDLDNDVDMEDFGIFQACITGANNPADLNCLP